MSNHQCILVVEDEEITAEYLRYRLVSLGYDVPVVAASGEDAIEATRTYHPDLVLMDIMLKGVLDGVEAADQIQRELDIPVVFITALSDPQTFDRAKKTGPFGYIVKPFDDLELQRSIEMALYKNRIEGELKESREWLATTLSSIGDAVIATDQRGNITFINAVAEEITNWKKEKIIDKPLINIFKLIDAKTGKDLENPITKVLNTSKMVDLPDQCLLVLEDGSQKAIELNLSPIKPEKGQVVGVVMVFRDITERKAIEEAMKIKDIAMESSINAIAITDLNGCLTYINRSFLRLWGYSHEDEVLGKPAIEFWHMEDKATEIIEGLNDRESWIGELIATRRDNTNFEVQFSATMVMDEYNKPVCMLASFVDISENLYRT